MELVERRVALGSHGSPPRAGIVASGVSLSHPDGSSALVDVDLAIAPGRLTAVIGPSGAGKTTLLRVLAGLVSPDRGTVRYETEAGDSSEVRVGYVPQDDILHPELPLRRTLEFAAALRLPRANGDARRAAVDGALVTLGLDAQAHLPVGSLSGGQRKRASVASELLADPAVCVLDEPTSGLDPSSSVALLRCLRLACDQGRTVAFTTHSVSDLEACDAVVVVGRGGRLVAAGAPGEVLDALGAGSFTELYELLDEAPAPVPVGPTLGRRRRSRRARGPAGPGVAVQVRYVATLTRRGGEVLVHNPLTLAIVLGSPMAVIAMFVVLFQPVGAPVVGADPTSSVMVAYWLAFAAFFFGLTFGLLQVCTETPILRREHHAGVSSGAYLASKLVLLGPLLVAINLVMVIVLRLLDRLPAMPAGRVGALLVTMALDALAGLALGLLASAAVGSPAQAALALPMLCFPAVLFSGAMVPVPVMAGAGRAIAALMSDRWAFEAIAVHLGVVERLPVGAPQSSLGSSPVTSYWLVLIAFTVVLGTAAVAMVRWRAVTGRD
ncbi:MAG TPA: ATP-binding cassette domain-containing protein [Acidimicrobiales bacterium]